MVNHSPERYGGANDDYLRLLKYLHSFRDRFHVTAMIPKGTPPDLYSEYCDNVIMYTPGFFPVTVRKITEYIGFFKVYSAQRSELKSILKDNKFDLAVLNVVVMGWVTRLLHNHCRQIVFIRETILPDLVRRLYYRFFAGSGDFYIAVSKSIETDYMKLTGKKNIITLNSAVESHDEHLNHSADWGDFIIKNGYEFLKDNKEKVFICLGALCERKNQMLILETAKSMKEDYNGKMPHFVFIGDDPEGNYRMKMESFILHNGLSDCCHLPGPLPRNMFYNQLDKVTGIIISSKSEGLPLVVSEALRFGAPLITTDVGGIRDVIQNNVNGLIIESSVQSLRNAIERLTEDEELSRKLSENGKETFERDFDLNKNLGKFAGIISSIIESPESCGQSEAAVSGF
ncbi:MAG: glycosyltransferase [Ignavibacteria bacterium]|nr:glycosyltransferase [Ignavibacteria bacterium]